MRLFVGVELDEAQRAACARAARDLQRDLGVLRRLTVRWIAEENLHITLCFLGELKEESAERVATALTVPWNIEPFTLGLGSAGAFPPSGPPRIVWLGVNEGTRPLAEIYGELTTRLTPVGYAAERRPYHPHVTIGRVKEADGAASRKMRDVLRQFAFNGGFRRVTSVTLFQSRLSPHGARYEALLRVPLKGC